MSYCVIPDLVANNKANLEQLKVFIAKSAATTTAQAAVSGC